MSPPAFRPSLPRLRLANALLLVEAAWILRAVHWGLRWVRWPRLQHLLRWSAGVTRVWRASPRTRDPEANILWAIGAAGRRGGFAASCLEEALSVQWMLRRRRVETRVRIGVIKHSTDTLLGHAWAEREGRVVSVDPISPAHYTVLNGTLDDQFDELHRGHLSL